MDEREGLERHCQLKYTCLQNSVEMAEKSIAKLVRYQHLGVVRRRGLRWGNADKMFAKAIA